MILSSFKDTERDRNRADERGEGVNMAMKEG